MKRYKLSVAFGVYAVMSEATTSQLPRLIAWRMKRVHHYLSALTQISSLCH